MAVEPARRRFTVDEYEQMAAVGILAAGDRLELIEGEIVEMTPIGSRHAACVKRLNRLIAEQVGAVVLIGVQDPIRLGERSEPQPDLMLLRPRDDDYAAAHPTAADALLLIEVADTTLDFDRGVKLPLYAREGVPECWLIDLAGQTVEQHSEPSAFGYRLIRRLASGESIVALAVPGLSLPLEAVLGR